MIALVERLLAGRPGVVLDVGHLLARPGERTVHGQLCVEGPADDPVIMQLPRRFDAVVMSEQLMAEVPPQYRRRLVHNAVQHLLPGGVLVAAVRPERRAPSFTLSEFDDLCDDCDLVPIGRYGGWDGGTPSQHLLTVTASRRTDRFTVHDLVFEARQSIRRLTAGQLASRLAAHAPPLVVDTRTQTDRARFGVIAGSIHVPRTVLEWHLDPINGYRHPSVTSFDQSLVLVCNQGYSSSLGAVNLVRLGFTDVADLVGGVHAWKQAGLPVVPADHDHLDL